MSSRASFMTPLIDHATPIFLLSLTLVAAIGNLLLVLR